jgi:NifU-like protein involved in Fe-S cluster formation
MKYLLFVYYSEGEKTEDDIHQIAEELSLPPVKIHCSVLAEEAIKAAIEDYKKHKNS